MDHILGKGNYLDSNSDDEDEQDDLEGEEESEGEEEDAGEEEEDFPENQLGKRDPKRSAEETQAATDYQRKLFLVQKIINDPAFTKDTLVSKSQEIVQLFAKKNFGLKDKVHTLVESLLFSQDSNPLQK